MELPQGILVPVLLAALIANIAVLGIVVVVSRYHRPGRGDRSTTSTVLAGSLFSSGPPDRLARLSADDRLRESTAVRRRDVAAMDAAAPQVRRGDRPVEDDVEAHAVGATAGAAATEATATGAAPEETPSPGAASDHAPTLDTEPVEPTSIAPWRTVQGMHPAESPQGIGADADPRVLEEQRVPSGTDPSTGLLDDTTFLHRVALEDLRIQRYHRPATVVIFELDGLDRLTARLGPDAAGRIVPALADTIRRLARESDQVARLSQSRFGVLLPETDEVAAINYVERVRRACELWLESGAIALRLSAGWAGTTGEPALPDAMRQATERMYVESRRHTRLGTEIAAAG
jgi:diguanylate cyclase (GGDEF)-like protein